MSLEPKTLQFDKAVPAAAASTLAPAEGVACVVCQQSITNQYFDINGQSVCDRCRDQVAQQAETPKGLGVFARAGLFGLGAAIAGAILYYAVIAITDFEIGLVAIAIGFMVGWGVRKGAGERGGRRFQILAVALTYWAVGLAYTPLVFQQIAQDQPSQQAAATTNGSTPATAEASTPESAAEPLSAAGLVVALGIVFAMTFALPVLVVFGSLPSGLISGAIIAFGMQQAWRMTGAPHLVISGPYRIASKMAS